MNKTKILGVTTLALVLLCGQLSAQEEGAKKRRGDKGQKRGGIMRMIKQLDQNGDKSLTADEIPDRLAKRLARLDLDENGIIDASEIQNVVDRIGQREGGMNKGKGKGKRKGKGNGKRKGKGNGKGKGKAKGNSGMEEDGKRRSMPNDRPGQSSDEAGAMKRRDRQMDVAGILKRLDKNGDSTISKDEAPDRMQRAFSRIDENADEILDEGELQKLVEMMKQRGEKSGRKKKRDREDPDGTSRKGVKPKRPGGQ